MFPFYELCFSNWFPFSACVMLHIPIVYSQNEKTFLSVFCFFVSLTILASKYSFEHVFLSNININWVMFNYFNRFKTF